MENSREKKKRGRIKSNKNVMKKHEKVRYILKEGKTK